MHLHVAVSCILYICVTKGIWVYSAFYDKMVKTSVQIFRQVAVAVVFIAFLYCLGTDSLKLKKLDRIIP